MSTASARISVLIAVSFGVFSLTACKQQAPLSTVRDDSSVKIGADLAKGVLKNRGVNTCGRDAAGATSAPNGRDWVLKVPYTQRLEHVKWLGAEFPGYADQGVNDLEGKPINTGLWDGIYLQTQWQARSGRDRDYWWAQNNWSLTEVPFWIGQHYRSKWQKNASPSNDDIDKACEDATLAALEKGDKKSVALSEGFYRVADKDWPTPANGAAPHSAKDVCVQLMKFYRVSDGVAAGRISAQPSTKAALRKEMWRMHEWNLAKANAGAQTSVHACQGEKDFQNAWAFIVNYVGASAIPSSGEMIGPGQPLVMPMCYPVGGPGCTKAELDHSINLFLVMLRELEVIGRGNPTRAKALELFLEKRVKQLNETADGIAFLFTGNTAKNPDIIASVEKFAAAKGSAVVEKAQALEQKVGAAAAATGQKASELKAAVGVRFSALKKKVTGRLHLAESDDEDELHMVVFADLNGDGLPDEGANLNDSGASGQPATAGAEVAIGLESDPAAFDDLIDAIGAPPPDDRSVPTLDELTR